MLADLTRRAGALAERGRAVLGIAGAPGAGKSTLAHALAATVPDAIVVGMDGFHRPTAWLLAHGWVAERGTPRTFDGAAYVRLLRRLRDGDTVHAPAFDRSIEEPVADAIEVPSDVRLVITEGNYLLLDDPPWSQIRALLDEAWYVQVPEDTRQARLVARHIEFGRSAAAAWWRVVHGSDASNAALVATSKRRADLIVDLD